MAGKTRWLARLASILIAGAGFSAFARAQQALPRAPVQRLQPVAVQQEIRKPLATERAPVPEGAVSIASVPAKAGSVRIPLSLPKRTLDQPNAGELRVVGGKGKIAVDAQGRATLEQVEPGSTIVSSGSAAAIARDSVISSAQKTALPWMVVDVAPPEQASIVRAARPFLQLARATHWDARLGKHIAELWVGLDPEGDSPTGKLAQPISASLSVSCEQVDPVRLTLDHVGAEGDRLVRVACSPAQKNARGKQSLTLRVDRGQLDYTFELVRRPGPLLLESSASAVPGFGLGALTLTLTQVEEDGTPLPNPQDEEIALIAQGGELNPNKLLLRKGQSVARGVAHVHGVGPLTVRAGSALRSSRELGIERSWPWGFLLVTLLGGALGGYLAVVRLRASSSRRVRTRKQAALRALEGMLVGLLVVAVVMIVPAIAPLVPDAARSSELGWLIVASLAGFAGVELVERIAALLFRKRESETHAAA